MPPSSVSQSLSRIELSLLDEPTSHRLQKGGRYENVILSEVMVYFQRDDNKTLTKITWLG